MSTLITVNPNQKLTLAKARDLTKQFLISENVGGAPGDPNLGTARVSYRRACELWPATMAIAAALVANDNTFSNTAMDALGETNAP